MSNTKTINTIEQKYFQSQSELKYQFSDFILCTKKNILIQGDQLIPLHRKAFRCLTLMVINGNKIVPRESFFDQVWNDCYVDDGVLNVNISYLRKILGKHRIVTYTGRGYRFNEQVKVLEDKTHSIENKVADKSIGFENTDKNSVSDLKRENKAGDKSIVFEGGLQVLEDKSYSIENKVDCQISQKTNKSFLIRFQCFWMALLSRFSQVSFL